MRILLINPNISAEMTARMVEAAGPALAPDVTLTALTATRGVPYIASRAEAQIAGTVALEMIAEHHHTADAVVIGAYGDPGLVPARELFEIPVTAMAEAAMHTACLLGRRFGIVTFSETLTAWYEDAVSLAGLDARCTGIRVPEAGFRSIFSVQKELEADLIESTERAAREDGADVVILAGAPLTGLARRIAGRTCIPLVDPLAAALGQAQALVRLAPHPARFGRFARPAPKPVSGLDGALGAWIEHATENRPASRDADPEP